MKKLFLTAILSLTVLYANLHAGPGDYSNFEEVKCELVPYEKSEFYHPDRPAFGDRLIASINKSTSSNWSGYVSASNKKNPQKHTVDAVSGEWVVPKLTSTLKNSFSAIWIGIDGFKPTDPTVEQIGTEQDWIDGVQKNYAWVEFFPKKPHVIKGFPVNSGDKFFASVRFENGAFTLQIINITKNKSFTTTHAVKKLHPKRATAEWIVEAPSGSSGVLPLANFGSVTFTNCRAVINGHSGSINATQFERIVLKQGKVKAVPGPLQNKGISFTVFHNNP